MGRCRRVDSEGCGVTRTGGQGNIGPNKKSLKGEKQTSDKRWGVGSENRRRGEVRYEARPVGEEGRRAGPAGFRAVLCALLQQV